MITEKISGVATRFKKTFNRDAVSAAINDPRSATREMTPGKGSDPSKFMNISPKKNVLAKLTKNTDSAFYTKVTAGQRPRLKKGDSLADVPAKLFNLIKKNQEDKRLNFEIYRDIDRPAEIKDETDRHNEIIEALNTRRKQTEDLEKATEKSKREYEKSKAEADKVIEEAKKKAAASTETVPTTPSTPVTTPSKPTVTTKPVETTTAQKTVPVKQPPSAKPAETPPVAPVKQTAAPTQAPVTTPSISTAAKVGVAAATGGVALSAAAKLSLKAEQSVNSVEDALKPNNDSKRVQKGEFSDTTIPKVGAATPDVKNSTSYGLFGINNIRKNGTDGKPIPGTSTIDSFVRDNPQLNLPEPGSNVEPAATKRFNEAWWKVSKEHPQKMLEAQMTFYKNKFEQPAIASLTKSGIVKDIAENPGVQVYMVDRRIAYGEALLKAALDYAKKARTPEEFIKLISEFDDSHLRVKDGQGKNIGIYGDKTTDEKYKELEKGLHNRIKTRTKAALEHVNDTGANLNQTSIQNKDFRTSQDTTIIIDNTQTNIVGGGTGKQKQIISQPSPQDLPMFQQVGP